MKAVFLDRQPSIQEIKVISKNLEEGAVIYALPHANLKVPFNYTEVELSKTEYQKITALSYQELDEIGLKLEAELTFEEINIWSYQRFRLFFELRKLLIKRHLIDLHSKDCTEVDIYSDVVVPIKKSGVSFDFILKTSATGSKSSKFKTLIFLIIKYIFSFLHIPILFRNFQNKSFLIYPMINRDVMLNFKGMEIFEVNHLYYLYEQYKEQFLLVQDNFMHDAGVNLGSAFRKSRLLPRKGKINMEAIYLFEIVRRPFILLKTYKVYKKLSLRLSENRPTDKDSIHAFVLSKLINFKSSNLVFIARNIIFKSHFKRKKYLNVVTIDENAALKKSILDAAKLSGLRTVGIQHGAIHQNLPTYVFDNRYDSKKYVPDLTLLWGEDYKDFLKTNSIYKDDMLAVVGQIRSDIIPKLDKSGKARQKNKFVFATQPIQDQNLRLKMIQDCFKACFHKNNFELIIRPHPSENPEYFTKVLSDIKDVPNDFQFKIESEMDLYLLLNQSDYLMTYYSTVGLEAMYFGKTLIVIDYHQEDQLSYVGTGGAEQVWNLETLNKLFERINNGTYISDHSNYQKLIDKYAFKIDGRVAERIVNKLN
ncbi:MAG: CDP-glycerol glycerophosphotransferase family protein [Flavobacteriales bacterium]|nr:CDP-glycerol glycerophosphotransferase family protein [Flavobacteriales bacterium]